jgi:hypothetical protein
VVTRAAWPRIAALLLLALCACTPRAPTTPVPATAPRPASTAPGPAALPTADAVRIEGTEAFRQWPALAAAVEAENAALRRDFEAKARAATARGEDASGWSLAMQWRALLGNRYLRVAEGEGVQATGDGPRPLSRRITYEGIGKEVVAFGDWFDGPAALADVARVARAALDATDATDAGPATREASRALADPASLHDAAYEPVFSADGPVMGFDLLLPVEGGAPLRVRIPRDQVEADIAGDRREVLDAGAASH